MSQTRGSSPSARSLPPLIQGGMGVGVSGWSLARAVSRAGQLGVVAGTALDVVHARLLQDGDPGGHLRRAYRAFPRPDVVDRVLRRWYVEGGRDPARPYRAHPMLTVAPAGHHVDLLVLANFAEVWLAKEGHGGLVGVNHLEKIQMATLPSLYGALLAGVDAVIMGAGIPSAIPAALDSLSRGEQTSLRVDVVGATAGQDHRTTFDPERFGPAPARRPPFLAVVSSVSLARFLVRDEATRPDGLVVELPAAGGHNAPPRGARRGAVESEAVYGPRDEVDLGAVEALGVPFWLAGGYGSHEGLRAARAAGARGVQVGTAFAVTREAGMAEELKAAVLRRAVAGEIEIRTDVRASPSGFPFKVASIPGTVSDPAVLDRRRRVCDLGYLRTPYVRPDGVLGYRCPSEPVAAYVRKGGAEEDTEGKLCLCNGLTATAGLAQRRGTGVEPALVTAGAAAADLAAPLDGGELPPAARVVERILGEAVSSVASGSPDVRSVELDRAERAELVEAVGGVDEADGPRLGPHDE